MTSLSFPALLQRFFTDRLRAQLGASPCTLRRLASESLRSEDQKQPKCIAIGRDLHVEDLDPSLLSAFLDELEQVRGNTARTRNTQLSALRAFFRYVAFAEPACALQCQRVIAIPAKRYERRTVEFLTEEEANALVTAPDATSWIGRRDRTLLLVAVHTGLRNTEIRSLRRRDVELGTGAHVRCMGKGRKMRCTPLRRDVAASLAAWLAERAGNPEDPVFPTLRGTVLSADALQRLVARHAEAACATCPSLAGRTITPHTLRHTTAMSLLRAGVDRTVIALWLGHECAETTQIYLHADMRLKENALAHADPSGEAPPRFRPTDELLAFLETL